MNEIKNSPALEYCQDCEFSSQIFGDKHHSLTKMNSSSIQEVAHCGVFFNSGFVGESFLDSDDIVVSSDSDNLSQTNTSVFEDQTNMNSYKSELVATCESSFTFNFDVENKLVGETDKNLIWLDTYDYCELEADWSLGIGIFFELKPNTVLKLPNELAKLMLKIMPEVIKRDGRTAYRFNNVLLELRVVNDKVHAFALGVSRNPVMFITWEETAEDLLVGQVTQWLTRKMFALSEDAVSLAHKLSTAHGDCLIMNRTFEALAVCYVDIPPRHIMIRVKRANVTPAWVPPNWAAYTKIDGVTRCHKCGRIGKLKCTCAGNIMSARDIIAKKKETKATLVKLDEMSDMVVNASFKSKRLPFVKYHDISKELEIKFAEPKKQHARMFNKVTHIGKRDVPSVVLANKRFEDERKALTNSNKKTVVSELIDRLVTGPKPKRQHAPEVVKTPRVRKNKMKVEHVVTPVEQEKLDITVFKTLFGDDTVTNAPTSKSNVWVVPEENVSFKTFLQALNYVYVYVDQMKDVVEVTPEKIEELGVAWCAAVAAGNMDLHSILKTLNVKFAQGAPLFPDNYPFNAKCCEPGIELEVEAHLDNLADHSIRFAELVGRLKRNAMKQHVTFRAYLLQIFLLNMQVRVSTVLTRMALLVAQGDPSHERSRATSVDSDEIPQNVIIDDSSDDEELYEYLNDDHLPSNALYRIYPGCEWSHYPLDNLLARHNFVVSFMATVPANIMTGMQRDCRSLFRMNIEDWLEYTMFIRSQCRPEQEIHEFMNRALSIFENAILYYEYTRETRIAAENRIMFAQGLLDNVAAPLTRAADATTKTMQDASEMMASVKQNVLESVNEVKRILSSYYTPVETMIKQVDSMFKWTDFVRIGLRFNALAQSELSWSFIISFLVDTMADISNAMNRALKNVEVMELRVEIYKMKQILECRDAALNAFLNNPENIAKYNTFVDAWKIDHEDYETSVGTVHHYKNGIKVAQGLSSLFDNFLSVIAGLTDNSMKYLRNFNCVVSAWRNARGITADIVKMLPNCVRELFGLVSDNFLLTEEDYVTFTREFAALDHKYTVEPRDIMEIPLKKLQEMHRQATEYWRRSTMCVTKGVNTVFLSYTVKRLHTIVQARTKIELLNSKRYNPIAILLHGKPGVGKSEVAKKIAAHFLDWAKDPELTTDPTFAMMAQPGMYSFQSQLDFFDGYHREGVMIIDELGSRTDGEDLVNLFSLVSSNTFIPPMASLEDDVIGCKATPFTSHSVIACANISQFDHLSGAFITPQAIDRRFVAKIDVFRNPKCLEAFRDDFSHLLFAINGIEGSFKLAELLYLLKYHPKFGFLSFFKSQMKIDHGLIELEKVDLTTLVKQRSPCRIVVQGVGAEIALSLAGIVSSVSFGFGINLLIKKQHKDFTDKLVMWSSILGGAIGMMLSTYASAKLQDEKERNREIDMEAESGKGGGKSGPAKVRTVRGRGFRGAIDRQGASARFVDFDGVEELEPTEPQLRRHLTQGVRDLVAMSVEDKAARCLCRIELYEGDHRLIGMNAIPLGHIHFLAPFHLLELDSKTTIIRIVWLASGKDFCLNSNKVVVTRFAEDAAVFSFPSLPWRAPSMLKNFIRDAELAYVKRCPISLITKNRGENIVGIYSTIGERMTEADEYHGTTGITYRILKGFHYEMNTTFGDCGGPIVCHDKDVPHKIIGFHVAGMVDAAYGMGTLVTYEMLEEVVGPDLLKNTELAPLKAMGSISLIGVHNPTLASNRRTNFYRTHVDCFPVPKQPTDLRIKDDVDPVLNAMMKNSFDRNQFASIDENVVQQTCAHLLSKMERMPGARVRTFDEALVAIGNLDRVNLKSSPGYPYVMGKRKTDFVEISEIGEINIKDPSIRVDTNRIIEEAKLYSPHIIWISCGKDENLKLDKQCRIFEIPPFSFTIALRQYFGDFVSYVHSNPMRFASIVGLNPESSQWHILMQRLRTISRKGLATDWKKFDSTLLLAAFELLARLANTWYDDGPVNATIRRNLIMASQHRVTVFEQFVLFILTGNPSGWMLTTIVNTFGQFLLFADFWLKHAPLEYRDLSYMDEFVCMFLYGDDGIIAVNEKVRVWFNFEALSRHFSTYGMKITSDAKDSDAAFLPIEDLTILKRGFRLDARNFWVPTMAWNTMYTMMNFQRKSKHATPEETMAVVYDNFQIFLYFYGRSVFDEVTKRLGMRARSFDFYNSFFYGTGALSTSIPE